MIGIETKQLRNLYQHGDKYCHSNQLSIGHGHYDILGVVPLRFRVVESSLFTRNMTDQATMLRRSAPDSRNFCNTSDSGMCL